MSNIAYFDCFSGAAGDMILAALLDAGLSADVLHETIGRLGLAGVALRVERVKRAGIAAAYVVVEIDASTPRKHRHLHHIVKIIDDAGLPSPVAEQSKRIFQRLAEAEAAVHGTTVEKVHFHEVGAEDAIVDVVGACAGLHALGVDRVECSPIPTGSGTVTCEHGVMPVPAPATARLLTGAPLAACEEPGELTTPTGAAILTTLAAAYGPPPEMRLMAVGVGAGTRPGVTRPNILRVLLGEAAGERGGETDTVCVLETQVDDATGQAVALACERVLESGALDAFITPIIMKKGRPGQLVTVLCRPEDAERLTAALFDWTGTLGVRRAEQRRARLARESALVSTPFGEIRVKVARRGEAVVRVIPEYDDCAAAARRFETSLQAVQQAALAAWSGAE